MATTPRNPSALFSSCSLLMACLFAYSASVQLNDPEWYLWLPLYALASAVNLLSVRFVSSVLNTIAKAVQWGGVFLFLRVVVEDLQIRGIAGFWSLSMEERVVREKLGSGLVVISMFLHQKASDVSETPKITMRGRRRTAAKYAEHGMALLVAVAFGLAFFFFAFVKEIRK